MAPVTAIPDSAQAIVKQFLTSYGLGSLANWAWKVYTGAGGGQIGLDTITAELPTTDQFKTRFPAYDKLAKQGRAMSVQEMLDYERSARQIFQANGIPGGFYDKPDELAQFMLHNVSVSELEARVKDAQTAMVSAPQDVRDQLQQLYGIDHGHLTAYFLDPTKAEPILQQKFTSAQIAASATRTGFGQLSAQQAEGLAQLGVTQDTATSGFNKLGIDQGLFEAQVAGEQQVGQDQQLQAQFGGNAAAQQAFEQRRRARLAEFAGDTGFHAGQHGVGGLGAAQTG